jgi:hypothetical protein
MPTINPAHKQLENRISAIGIEFQSKVNLSKTCVELCRRLGVI